MTRPDFLVPVSVRTAAAAAALLAFGVVLASCGGDEEVAPVVTAAGTTTAAPNSTPAPSISSSANPTGWQGYSHPLAKFSFEYPVGWSLQEYAGDPQARIASFDLLTWTGPGYPAGGVLVDIGRVSLDQAEPRPGDASDSALGTLTGWSRRLTPGDEAPWAKAVSYSADDVAFRYYAIAYFADAAGDEAQVSAVVGSFKLDK